MNVLEGCGRMRQADRRLFVPFAASVALPGMGDVMAHHHGDLGSSLAVIPIVLPFLIIPGAASWAAGRLVEGFAKERR